MAVTLAKGGNLSLSKEAPNLTEVSASTETAMVFGEIYRRGGEWKFRAIGQGYVSGLAGIVRDYGISV